MLTFYLVTAAASTWAQENPVISPEARVAAENIIAQTSNLGDYKIFADRPFNVSPDSEALKNLNEILYAAQGFVHAVDIKDKSQIGFVLIASISDVLKMPFSEAYQNFCKLKEDGPCPVFSRDVAEKVCGERTEFLVLPKQNSDQTEFYFRFYSRPSQPKG